ncbi:hypothetical protein FOL47_008208 [Perkinsus chesapeaki]|uniref:Uncharacterized protein n=1 Tax=Perkinsus chesapeaki TaxID=330153 RepID=A0A7J6LFS3_PERCH|nr:hypothetical protein FOL47_008208 [Perkinsus chesapeaki]
MAKLLQLHLLVIFVLVIPGYAQKHTFKGVYTTKASALTVEITYDESKPQTMVVYLEDSKDKHTFNVKATKNKYHKGRYDLKWDQNDYDKVMPPFLQRLDEPYVIAMTIVIFTDDWAEADYYVFSGSKGVPPLKLKRVP